MVAWQPGGELLASASYDDSIKLWRDVGDEWECTQTLSGALLSSAALQPCFSANGSGSRQVSADAVMRLMMHTAQTQLAR